MDVVPFPFQPIRIIQHQQATCPAACRDGERSDPPHVGMHVCIYIFPTRRRHVDTRVLLRSMARVLACPRLLQEAWSGGEVSRLVPYWTSIMLVGGRRRPQYVLVY